MSGLDLKALIAQSKQGPSLSEQVKAATETKAPAAGNNILAGEVKSVNNAGVIAQPAGNAAVPAKPTAGFVLSSIASNTSAAAGNSTTPAMVPKSGSLSQLVKQHSQTTAAVIVPPTTAVATAPQQEIPPSPTTPPEIALAAEFHYPQQKDALSQQAAEDFRAQLDLLRESLDRPDIVGQAIRHIMTTTKENPHFCEPDENGNALLMPEDVGMMVRALRVSYQTAIIVKEKKTAKPKEKAMAVDAALDLMANLKF